MKNICVFCGSSTGYPEIYKQEAVKLGQLFALNNFTLVFGGGKVGIMGVLADSVMEAGGSCIGIMPKNIADLEIAHQGITKLIIVKDMYERKAQMADLSDGFIAFPGGLGTLDELSEVLTHNQLRISDNPVGILNIDGYFNNLLKFLDHCTNEGFIRSEHRENIIVEGKPAELIKQMKGFKPVTIEKWIRDIKTESVQNQKG
ncbi:MAG: TIGR00730 family Rossman fold protein [Bacteroidales bacterium]|nr:TIGR00730 family Rossman fold protein [Bacteroidales bacterium]